MLICTDKTHGPGNALQHGLRSASTLLPGEDAEAFERLRNELFHDYRPRTRDEALCVETLASCHWRIDRCRRIQAAVDAHVEAVTFGTAVPGHICDPDQHDWFHKSRDCVDQEGRLDRILCRARDKLFLLQKQRRQDLVPGVIDHAPVYGPSDSLRVQAVRPPAAGESGESPAAMGAAVAPVGPSPAAVPAPTVGASGGRPPEGGEIAVSANVSADGEKRKSDERTTAPPEPASASGAPAAPQVPASAATHPIAAPCDAVKTYSQALVLHPDAADAEEGLAPNAHPRGGTAIG